MPLAETLLRTDTPAPPAVPASTMLNLDLMLTMLSLARKVVGDDLTATMVLASVVRINTEGFDEDATVMETWSAPESPAPDNLRQPVSGYAAALALGLARETVRRKLHMLASKGLIEQRNGGYFMPASAFSRPDFQHLSRRTFETARGYFAAMEKLGLVAEPHSALARSMPPKPRAAGRATDSFVLKALDDLSRITRGDSKAAVLFAALYRARHSGARITALQLAANHGLSRETGRRRIQALERMRLVRRVSGGLVLSPEVSGNRVVLASLQRVNAGEEAFLRRLANAGIMSGAWPGPAAVN